MGAQGPGPGPLNVRLFPSKDAEGAAPASWRRRKHITTVCSKTNVNQLFLECTPVRDQMRNSGVCPDGELNR